MLDNPSGPRAAIAADGRIKRPILFRRPFGGSGIIRGKTKLALHPLDYRRQC